MKTTLINQSRAFTLIEILMTIVLLSVLATVALTTLSTDDNENKFQETLQEMDAIRDAMIGNLNEKEGNIRTDYGFLGDIGAIPTAAQGIAALTTNPSLPAWSMDTAVRFGKGWNGPYLESGKPGTDYTTDAWGTSYVYSPTASPPTLVSYGADRASGDAGNTPYDADISVELSDELRSATVYGFIGNGGQPYVGDAEVELNDLSAGAVSTSSTTLTSSDSGAFSFSSISFGKRSVTIYIPSKASATQTIGPVVFHIDRKDYYIDSSLTDINPDGSVEEVVFEDDFNRADNTTLGNSWTEVTSSGDATITSNMLEFTTTSNAGANDPLVKRTFTSQSTGTLKWTFDFNLKKTGSDANYRFYFQLGNSANMTDTALFAGIAVNLVWAGAAGAYMPDDMAFGYQNLGFAFNQLRVTSESYSVTVKVDIDNKVYSVWIDNYEALNVGFQAPAQAVPIDTIRFFSRGLAPAGFSPKTIDNVKITK